MPTEKPRITSYLDPVLYEKLEEFKKAKKLKTLSKAVIAALEDYFETLEQQSAANKKQNLREIKQEIEEMQTQLNELSKKVDNLDSELEKEDEDE